MLSISYKEYATIRNQYPNAMDDDCAADFVVELLKAEAEATRRKHPNARNTARRLEEAAEVVRLVASDLSGELFEEVE